MIKFIKTLYKKSNLQIISRIADPISEKILNNDAKNLKRCLQRKALEDSVAFISENMIDVKSFQTKFMVLEDALSKVDGDGLFLEFGVFSATTINYIAKLRKNNLIFGFDSFEGLPEAWNTLAKGAFKVKELPKTQNNVTLIKGWFNETIPVFKQKENGHIAFMHIDCDLYSSTKTIFQELDNQIGKNTVIVFDEYFNYFGWQQGEFKAFNEYVKEKNITYEFLSYCYKAEQVAIKIISKK